MSAAFVQQAGIAKAVTPWDPSVTITVGAGNALVAWVEAVSTTFAISVSDDKGNPWALAEFGQGAGSIHRTEIWAVPNCAGGSTIVTATLGGTGQSDCCLFLAEFSGLPLASILDLTSKKTNTATTAWGSGLMVAGSTQLFVAGCQSSVAGPLIDAACGFTALTNQTGADFYRAAYKIGSGGQEATWTLGSASTGQGVAALFNSEAGDPAPPRPNRFIYMRDNK